MTPAQIASKLTKAQRDIMLGHLVDIPPDESDALKAADLKGDAFFHDEGDYRRMVWPITPKGLELRAAILASEGEG